MTPDFDAVRKQMIGKSVAFMQVWGINTLKTVDPPLTMLAGETVVELRANEQERRIQITLSSHVVEIDLARTGTVSLLQSAEPWPPTAGTPMPTARIGFTDLTGVDLREPARTKRITLAVRPIAR
jgi:hypothetical protein